MDQLLEIAKFIFANYAQIIAGIVGIFSAVLVVALIIPGQEPDKTLQKIVDFISKFSKK